MQDLSAPVWEKAKTDPLPCARGLFSLLEGRSLISNVLGPKRLENEFLIGRSKTILRKNFR